MKSASINVLAHRGPHQHMVHVPPFLNWYTDHRLERTISGPALLLMGVFVSQLFFVKYRGIFHTV
ncbi:hypothetical protein EEL30_13960 [Brevibacillus laterosporus]|uniref:Uncharacterized protein n=1 Tax=Brevibacillus laterosporus TaxID=1465 RepID=A0A518V8I6_BRELA|nr:hypothetical protein EEL30_13960 [Brevibacillus laterosporus]